MTRVAVILSGSGHLDGAEIRESIITLLELDKAGADVSCFAPNINQHHVINHLTGEPTSETRNVLVEAARIARGKIHPLDKLNADDFDALIIPGGFGVAKNLSDLAFKGTEATILPAFKNAILTFLDQKKPIGVICISPAVLVAALKDTPYAGATVTLGDDTEQLIEALGGKHIVCLSQQIATDEKRGIVSCSAYMRNDSLASIAEGIAKLVRRTLAFIVS